MLLCIHVVYIYYYDILIFFVVESHGLCTFLILSCTCVYTCHGACTVDFNTDGPQCNPAIELNNDHSYANMVEWN